ncbi:MAG TPA: YqhA family protein [Streptosporangiaceae bacterium]|nr:YqhA family protein [Streptosporangiaceae bacterium]
MTGGAEPEDSPSGPQWDAASAPGDADDVTGYATDPYDQVSERGQDVQRRFERFLALSRLLTLIPVIFLLLDAAGSFVYGADILIRTADGDIGEPARVGGRLGIFLIVMDTFLVGATLLIAAYGFYELFVIRRERPGHDHWLPSWLWMRDLEDLKARVVSMLILVAAITFVDILVESHDERGVLFLGLGVAAIVVALTAFLRFGRRAEPTSATGPSASPPPSGGPTRASPSYYLTSQAGSGGVTEAWAGEVAAAGAGEVAAGGVGHTGAGDAGARQAGTGRPGTRQAGFGQAALPQKPGHDAGTQARRSVVAIAGFATLDLRDDGIASQPGRQVAPIKVRLVAVLGQVKVLIPPGMQVADSGLSMLGIRTIAGHATHPKPGAPLLVTTGASFLGRVKITRAS